MESIRANEDGLISGRNPGQAGAQVHHARHELERHARGIDRHVEASPNQAGIGDGAQQVLARPIGKPGIGVQEQQNVALRQRGARVHLGGASARRRDDAVGKGAGLRHGGVGAAPIDDDDLGSLCAHPLEPRERLADRGRLLEGWNDNREHPKDHRGGPARRRAGLVRLRYGERRSAAATRGSASPAPRNFAFALRPTTKTVAAVAASPATRSATRSVV